MNSKRGMKREERVNIKSHVSCQLSKLSFGVEYTGKIVKEEFTSCSKS